MNSDIVITIKVAGGAGAGGVQVGETVGVPTPSEDMAGFGAASAAAGAAPTPDAALGAGESGAAEVVPSPTMEGGVAGAASGALPVPVGLDQIEQLSTSADFSASEEVVPEPEGDG